MAQIFKNTKISFKVLFSILFFFSLPLFSDNKPENLKLAYYKGMYTNTNLGEILLKLDTHNRQSYINMFSIAKPFLKLWKANIETEGQVGWHTGVQKHMEFNGLFLARFGANKNLPVNFAVGEGLSLATRNPDLENPRKNVFYPSVESEYSNKLLNYLAFEVELSLPSLKKKNVPSPFFRVHHRSGVYGIFCPPTCGSNYLTYGVRWSY